MSSLLKSAVLLAAWACAAAESQWCDVASDSSGKYLVAVGYACSKVLISNDFGVTWTYTKAPDQYWGSVWSDPTGQHLVVGPHFVGSPTTVQQSNMYSLDRGLTWTSGTYNMDSAVGLVFSNKISGETAAKKLITVSESKKLIKSSDGGAQWFGVDNVPANKTMGYNGYATAMSANGAVFYATDDVSAIYVSKNSGTLWTKAQDQCTSACGGEWKNFVADSTGQYLFAHTNSKAYFLQNYGASMTEIFSSSATIIDIAADPSAKYLYILTLDGLYTYTRATDKVALNTNLKIVVNQGYGAYSIATSSNGQHIIVSVQPEGLYISDDFGNSWKNIRGLTETA